MLTHHSLSGEGLILGFLLIAKLTSLGLFMRNLHIDILVLQSLKPQVTLDLDVIGNPFRPPLGIEQAFIVGLPRIGGTELDKGLRRGTSVLANTSAKVGFSSSKAFRFKPVKARRRRSFFRARWRFSTSQLRSLALGGIIPYFTTGLMCKLRTGFDNPTGAHER